MATQAMTKPAGQTTTKTDLYAQADLVNNAIVWSLDNKNPPKKNSKINLNFGKNTGSQDISVTLLDTTGLGLKFSSDPLWVSETGGCPPPAGVNSDQIQSVVPAGSLLTFTDTNTKDCNLIYQMNFVDQANNPVAPLDPEIKNGGTGFHASTALIVTVLVIGVAAVVAYKLLST